jgi:hypothetical protein
MGAGVAVGVELDADLADLRRSTCSWVVDFRSRPVRFRGTGWRRRGGRRIMGSPWGLLPAVMPGGGSLGESGRTGWSESAAGLRGPTVSTFTARGGRLVGRSMCAALGC